MADRHGVDRSRGRRPQPRRTADAARRAAFDVLRAVERDDAYANLVLPALLAERGLSGRDAAFATELAYGTLRMRGRYDAILAIASTRPPQELDPPLLDVLRLGAHQLLGMRVAAHAAVSETVTLAREVVGAGASSYANAVLRAIGRAEPEEWDRRLAERTTDPTALLTRRLSHPEWVVRAFREALALDDGAVVGDAGEELLALLEADNAAPAVTLVARPGLAGIRDLPGATPARWARTAAVLGAGDPASIEAVRTGRAAVQDEGSQLVALALAAAPVDGPDDAWLDLCAGPGGKTALLSSLLAERGEGGRLLAAEVVPHRADLVRRAVRALPPGLVEVRALDGRELGTERPGAFDRVLVDAPCTGLGALRRRPEARWRRSPADLASLGPLQRDLLTSAVGAVRPGGVVAYVTCSPHLAETRVVVDDVMRRVGGLELLDAAAVLDGVSQESMHLGAGPYAQLWPHRHGTDAMFLALLRRTG
ncbi:Fmu (Sun) domain protein [Beutenbergia cavernae DSM 12333]|uniref:Fmu (Sun) domain protein n=1 Tax=Beutenbergia cavernae (strain ATCC BAA-8 / DSM 12333 / CCUG 43141 / JCM 11478 / NBRC 16432 / NCIMB 13614 / HKI 0122) TaxID=471853 RepID=C5C698_BEUC1|nr:transcription antitermination factor NusB [Beutenbergia cavernae]ACQ80304.1 Fmu (Sun) domain protein [Beutenbergia cavernae DSM 12333]